MGTIRKQSLLGLISVQSGQLVGLLNKAVLFPIVFLGAKEYWGLYELFYSYAMIAVTIMLFGNSRLIVRILPRDNVDAPVFLGWVFKRMVLPAILGFIALIAFSDQISGFIQQSTIFNEHYALFILVTASVLLFDVASAVSTGRFKAHVPLLVNNVFMRLSNTVVLLLQWKFQWDMSFFLTLLSLNYTLNFGAMFFYVMRKEKVNFNSSTLSKEDERHYKSFSRVIGMNNITTTTQSQILSTILAISLGLEEVAIFNFARNFYSIVEMPGRLIMASSSSTMSKSMSNNDMDNVKSVYNKSSIAQFLSGVILLAFILANIDWLIGLYKDTSFTVTKDVLLIMGIGKLVDLITGVNGNIISNSDYFKFNLYFGFVMLAVMVGAAFFLVDIYGLIGVAMAYAFMSIFSNVVRSVYVQRKLKIHFFSRTHVGLIIFGVLLLSMALFPHNQSVYTNIGANAVMIIVSAVYVLRFNPLTELSEILAKIPVIRKFTSHSK